MTYIVTTAENAERMAEGLGRLYAELRGLVYPIPGSDDEGVVGPGSRYFVRSLASRDGTQVAFKIPDRVMGGLRVRRMLGRPVRVRGSWISVPGVVQDLADDWFQVAHGRRSMSV
jgi:hypothetical protein